MVKYLENLYEKLEHKYKDNKYAHTTVDAFGTFLFAPKTTTSGKGVHIKDGMDLKRTMISVVAAMTLCLIMGTYNIGHQHYSAFGLFSGGLMDGFGSKLLYGLLQILPLLVISYGVGLGVEFFFAARKGHAVEEGYLVSGMLIALIMPPDIPLWMVAVAVIFAVIIAKEAFGGTGMNILNIALTARVFVFFAYPTEISGDIAWVAYDYNFLHEIFGMGSATLAALGQSVVPEAGWASLTVDGFSGATPLALAAKGGWEAVQAQYSISDMVWGNMPGSVGEMNKLAVVAGALILVLIGIGSWQIMISMVVGAAVTGLIFNLVATDPNSFIAVPFQYHFIMGSLLFAMAFMATDPVTAAQTETGKYIYGFLIGVAGIIIRVLNPAYPEGWMLAILFMNVFAPLIDHYVLQANIKRRTKRLATAKIAERVG